MSVVKVQVLGKDNYDTWCIHAKAYLIKQKLWKYVQDLPKENASEDVLNNDELAKSELLLLIAPSELKQVKNCKYARDVWTTLNSIYESKGPARKATLLKQLILAKLLEGDDVREHLKKIMDTVDKLKDMDIDINNDLLSIMILYSLSSEYENFRTAIESQDLLPNPEKLKIKIIEESDARRRNLPSTRLLEELTDFTDLTGQTTIYVDNESAIKLSENPPYQFHRRTKHIKTKHFFIRECIQNGDFIVKQVSTELQLADMFTKPLFGPRLNMLSSRIGLQNLSKF